MQDCLIVVILQSYLICVFSSFGTSISFWYMTGFSTLTAMNSFVLSHHLSGSKYFSVALCQFLLLHFILIIITIIIIILIVIIIGPLRSSIMVPSSCHFCRSILEQILLQSSLDIDACPMQQSLLGNKSVFSLFLAACSLSETFIKCSSFRDSFQVY